MALFEMEHGLGPFWNRCFLCGTDLELDWPDLTELVPSDIKNRAHDDWRWAAAMNCPFCSIVIAILNDAGREHDCSVPDDYRLAFAGGPLGNYIKGFQVVLARNESTGKYLLALEVIWIPLPENEWQRKFWGIITVYLDGVLVPFSPLDLSNFV